MGDGRSRRGDRVGREGIRPAQMEGAGAGQGKRADKLQTSPISLRLRKLFCIFYSICLILKNKQTKRPNVIHEAGF